MSHKKHMVEISNTPIQTELITQTIERIANELSHLENLVDEFPNDQELGRAVRDFVLTQRKNRQE